MNRDQILIAILNAFVLLVDAIYSFSPRRNRSREPIWRREDEMSLGLACVNVLSMATGIHVFLDVPFSGLGVAITWPGQIRYWLHCALITVAAPWFAIKLYEYGRHLSDASRLIGGDRPNPPDQGTHDRLYGKGSYRLATARYRASSSQ